MITWLASFLGTEPDLDRPNAPRIDIDRYWTPGAIRIRAKATDPFAGLRGHAYIAARKLDQFDIQKVKDARIEGGLKEGQANLVNAINRYPAERIGKSTYRIGKITYRFASGSMDYLKSPGDRRFFVVQSRTEAL